MGFKFTAWKGSRCSKWIVSLLITLVIYTIVGFFVVPAIVKSQMLKRIPALTHRQASVEQVKVNPYALSLTIRGFSLKETNGDVFTSFDEFYANFQLSSIFKQAWVFKEITLKRPFSQITYRQDGTFNFADLLNNTNSPAPTTNTSSVPPRIIIGQLMITNGAVSFTDLTRKTPFHSQFIPIDLNLTNLTTIRDKNSPYSFLARTDSGESFAWSGRVSINPVSSSGTFRLGGLKIGKYSSYSQDYAKFQIADGLLDIAADYHYDSSTNAMDLEVSKAVIHLTHLQLKAPDTGETVLNIPALSILDAEASVLKRTAKVGLIKSADGSILVRQNQDGTINLLSLLNLPPSAPASSNAPTASPESSLSWSAVINEISFTNYSLKVEDNKPAKPANLILDQIAFTLKNVSNLTNAPVTALLSLRFQKTGSIGIEGTLNLLPLAADLQLTLTNLDLRAVQPYVHEQAKLEITSGAFDLQGQAHYSATSTNAPGINFAGNLAIRNFITVDDVLFKDFAKWNALTVDGIKLDLQKIELQLEQIKFDGLNTSLIIGPDHRANLQTILQKEAAPATNALSTATSPATKSDFKISLATLAFENGSIHFADESLQPHCDFAVQEFAGTIKDLSSQQDTTAAVDLKGKVDAHAPFTVTGKINPLAKDLFADVSVSFKNTELTAFTPYLEKYAGYPLKKGKLGFDVHYLVSHGELKAENGVHVDQLTLGAKNASLDATHLPVKLAVALLKDRNGLIALDLPVHGRIDDPKFKIGGVIMQVFMNVITKAVTSPFALLGSMFGGGEELSFIDFHPGQSALTDGEIKKLDTLSKALFERPALELEINGSMNPTNDRPALAKIKYDQQIKSLAIKELTDSGKPAVSSDEVQLDPKHYARLVKRAYKQTLGRYQPSVSPEIEMVSTSPSDGTTNKPITHSFSKKASTLRPERGATLLFQTKAPVNAVPKASLSSSPAAEGEPQVTVVPLSELADMEGQLLKKIVITDDDLRTLMQERAKKVEDYLLQTGKVSAERLFIIAPKAIDASFKGENRVNLSLN
ncbi:MAG: uncharacterized protein JWQ71_3958 [Pedosphaera sp.]|nr:uncharacterized protein [Pedosphaera sp.]